MTEELKTIDTVDTSPFKKLVMTIGELPTSFVESMTYYELLAWLCNYLQGTVIPAVNNNAKAVTELQQLYIELKSYVDNYFDNLDVQDEINNKLDQMAEDGQLTQLIAQFLSLNAIMSFPSVAAMKLAENLVNGSTVETYGFYNAGDEGGAKYLVRTVTNEDVIDEKTIIALYDNTLIAELIVETEMNVKQFGAKGDNSTNDSSSFQAALNLCHNVFVPNGTYLLNDTITITNKNNIKLFGNGAIIEIATTGHGFVFTNTTNLEIDNLVIKATAHYNSVSSTNTDNHMIKVFTVDGFRFTNSKLQYGCMGLTIGDGKNIVIDNNQIDHFKGWGLFIGCDSSFGTTFSEIDNCRISNNTCYSTGYDGIKMTGYISNIEVFGNESYSNTRDGFDFAGHTIDNLMVHNNYFHDNTLNGIELKTLERSDYPYDNTKTKQFKNILINHNIVKFNNTQGINFQLYYTDLSINNIVTSDNTISISKTSTTGSAGIRVAPLCITASDSFIIDNNTIHNDENVQSNTFGIRLTNASNVLVKNNLVSGVFQKPLSIEYNATMYTDYGATTDGDNIINNTFITTRSGSNCISSSEANISNIVIKDNKLSTALTSYQIATTLYGIASNVIVGNEYCGGFFDSIPTNRTTKGVIFRSSDPITTACYGWIGKENNASAKYAVYLPISLS